MTPTRAARWRPAQVLGAIAWGAAAVGLWPLYRAWVAPGPWQVSVVVAHLAGMLAGYGVVVLVGLMARTPELERGVGADRLSRWHSAGGRTVVALALLHAGAAVTSWADSRQENAFVATWHVLALPGLIAATVGTALFVAVGVLSVRAARRRVSYEVWHTIHLLVYLAVALSFVHQLAGPDLAGYRGLQVVWALLYTGVFYLVLEHRVITPLRNAGRHRMRVVAVHPEGPGVVSIVVEGRQLHELQAESGQFFRWRFLTPDLWLTAHPFSLSAARSEADLLFRDELDRLAAGRGGRVRYVLGDSAGSIGPGPVSAELLHRLVPGLVDRDVYLCGPPSLSRAVRDALRSAGLPEAQLHEERFAR